MLRRSGHRRAGITLIELLVVIAIITILVSLLMSAVMKTLVVGPRAETTARIAAINNAINTFKSNSQFGQVKYIPAGRPDGTNTPFRLRNSYTPNTNPNDFSPEAMYIVQVFGTGTNLADLGYRNAAGQPGLTADLDANQTLTFFLCGFPETDGQGNANFTGFANGQQPFALRGTATDARRGPVLDLGGRKKYEIATSGTGIGFARMIDGFGTPFAYFCSYNGMPNRYFGYNVGGPYGGANGTAAGGVVQAYGTGIGTARKYEQESGYQIISAGENKRFGLTGNWANVDRDGQDDQANFTPFLLGAGRQ